MAVLKCKICGELLKKNGFTKSGKQRWRCRSCGASFVKSNNTKTRWLKTFVRWLLGKLSQSELDYAARTFRDHTAIFWKYWPILPICDEVHHVVYLDGLWIARGKAVLLIACTDDYIIGCHLAKSENSKDWGCLMRRIAPPDVLVCDGGGGIEKALKAFWPRTRLQRCTFHAFEQVKRCTTTKPNLQAGVELYALAKRLLHIEDQTEAAIWLADFSNWCTKWEEFLKERSVEQGRVQYKHEKLRKARRGLEKLCRAGTLFTYLDEELIKDGYVSPTSNRIESVNARIRDVLRHHRGLSIDRRIKAGFWWCYMNSEAPISYQKMLKFFPTDEKIMEWRRAAAQLEVEECEVARWGTGLVWSEFHHSTPYPFATD